MLLGVAGIPGLSWLVRGKLCFEVEERCTVSFLSQSARLEDGKTATLQSGKSSLMAQTRRLLREHGLHARKGLGQHYLVNEDVLQRIIAAAELSKQDVVIEVGPGLGFLTAELLKRAGRVIAIEIDEKLVALLQKRLPRSDNLTIINSDILQLNPADLLEQVKPEGVAGYKVVANLPYYITSPVIRLFLESRIRPGVMVLMVQKEVAEAIAAKPGNMSILAVSVQFYGRPEIVSRVPAALFYPPPEVDSAILKIEVYDKPPVDVDTAGFFEVVRAGFSSARKQLANPLAQGLKIPKEEAHAWLKRAGINPQLRAEALGLEDWARLWREYIKAR